VGREETMEIEKLLEGRKGAILCGLLGAISAILLLLVVKEC